MYMKKGKCEMEGQRERKLFLSSWYVSGRKVPGGKLGHKVLGFLRTLQQCEIQNRKIRICSESRCVGVEAYIKDTTNQRKSSWKVFWYRVNRRRSATWRVSATLRLGMLWDIVMLCGPTYRHFMEKSVNLVWPSFCILKISATSLAVVWRKFPVAF